MRVTIRSRSGRMMVCPLLALGAVWGIHWMATCVGPSGGFEVQELRFSTLGPSWQWGHNTGYMWAEPGQTIVVDYDVEMNGRGFVDLRVGKYNPQRLFSYREMEYLSIMRSGRGRFTYRVTKTGLHAVMQSDLRNWRGSLKLSWRLE